MKFTLTDITDYFKDEQAIAGDASHEGYRAVMRLVVEEEKRKVDDGKWDGLPFTCEAADIDDAIDCYNEEVCRYDYIKALAADYETEGGVE